MSRGLVTRRVVRPARALAAAIVIGCAALPQVREFHASILTESVFLSLVMVILGLALRFVYHPTWQQVAAVAVTAGVSVTVRFAAL